MRIELLVEGHGDQLAIPSLLANFLYEHGFYFGNPVRAPGYLGMANRKDKAKNYIKSRLEYSPSHILYLADCDEHCPLDKLQTIYDNAKEAMSDSSSDVKFGVVIFNPEYEAIFLTSHENIKNCAPCPIEYSDIESLRDSKHIFERMIGHSYKETEHQKLYTKYVSAESLSHLRCGQHLLRLIEWIASSDEQFYCDL